LYPDAAKVAKQFQHADKRGIPFDSGRRTRDWQHRFAQEFREWRTVSLDFEGLKKSVVIILFKTIKKLSSTKRSFLI
jgi:histidyl-tRNA synthetase